jgi:hypothetical protein
MGDKVLLAKLGIAVLCLLASVWLVRSERPQRLSRRWFDVLALLSVAVTRLGLFGLVYVVLKQEPQSDLAVYYEWTRRTLDGTFPGSSADVPLHYGPLFHYFAGIAVALWDSGKAIALQAIVVELLSIPLWMAVGRSLFTERVVRHAAILYAIGATPIMTTAIGGSNQVLLSPFLALAILLGLRSRHTLGGFSIGLSIVVVKFLSLLQAPALAVAAWRDRRGRGSASFIGWCVGCAIAPILVYGFWQWRGVNVLEGIMFHEQHSSSGNLPYFLSIAGLDFDSGMTKRIANLVGLAALGSLFLWLITRRRADRPQATIHIISATLFMALLVSKKAFPSYQCICYFPIVLSAMATRQPTLIATLLGALGVTSMLESGLWFRWMDMHDLRIIWDDALPDGVTPSKVVAFVVVEVLTLALYAWMCALSSMRVTSEDRLPESV